MADVGSEKTGEKRPAEAAPPTSQGRSRDRRGETQDGKKPRIAHVDEEGNKLRLRKCVILLGYNGTAYQGMQRNPGAKSLEDELVKALQNANVIHGKGVEKLQDMQFQRTARTDKGVHAARQVVSLKMGVPENVEDKINEHLPKDMRVFWVTRVTKGFNCKQQCSGRRYEYVLPTYALMDKSKALSADYRADHETIERLREALQQFVGTHNFHNFTSGKAFTDQSSNRYIVSYDCGEPFVRQGIEWVSLTVRGQSFVLNQIRKMVGMAVAVVRGYADLATLNRAFDETRVDVPRAPGLGLLLDSVYFEAYNKQFGGSGGRSLLTWDHLNEETEKFKDDMIYSELVATEKQQKIIWTWLHTLSSHDFDKVRENYIPDLSHKRRKAQVDATAMQPETPGTAVGEAQEASAVEEQTQEAPKGETA